MSSTRQQQGGFTLLEVMVALVVLSFIVLGLGEGLRFGLSAWSAQTRAIAARDELDAAERLLRGVIERMDPGRPGQSQGDAPMFRGLPGAMQFHTRLPVAADTFAIRIVDAALGVDAEQRLVLRLLPNHSAAAARVGQVVAEELLAGVARIELSYWRPPRHDAPGVWLREWSERGLPELVRIHIVFVDNARHWPDIVAAPMREPIAN